MSSRPARVRLLEGFLLRLAAAPDADAFALRGGMLVRTWLDAADRQIRDADLVCSLPYRPRHLRAALGAILADRGVIDGVFFDDDRFRVDFMWPGIPHPGLKLFAAGEVDGIRAEITVDVTFELEVWPAPTRSVLTAGRGAAARWMCAHEMVIGTKLCVIAELGPREWRPKDLADIWLALRRYPPTSSFARLGEAIERSFAHGNARGHDAKTILATPWWRDPRAAMRWGRYVARNAHVPNDLDVVIAEVSDKLAPLARPS